MASECQGKKTCNAFCPASKYAVRLRSAVSAQWPKRGQGKEGEGGVKPMQVRDSWHTENNQTPKRMEYLVRQRMTGGLRTSPSSSWFSLRKNAQLTGQDTCVAVSIRTCQSTGEKIKEKNRSPPTKDPNLLSRTYIRYVKNAHICTSTARSPCQKA